MCGHGCRRLSDSVDCCHLFSIFSPFLLLSKLSSDAVMYQQRISSASFDLGIGTVGYFFVCFWMGTICGDGKSIGRNGQVKDSEVEDHKIQHIGPSEEGVREISSKPCDAHEFLLNLCSSKRRWRDLRCWTTAKGHWCPRPRPKTIPFERMAPKSSGHRAKLDIGHWYRVWSAWRTSEH